MPSWGNILKRIEKGEMEKAPPHVTALNLYAGKLTVLEPGRFTFDEAEIEDVPVMRWSPYHNRPMRARVAATLLRGQVIWDGKAVLATPGTGRFIRREAH